MLSKENALLVSAGAAAGAAAAYLYSASKKRSTVEPMKSTALAKFVADASLGESEQLTVCGTMLICTQNLAVSGANQVVLNIVEGQIWRGNVVVLSPSTGPFAKEFSDLGVSVQIGTLEDLLSRVRDVRVAICNTIMTAHLVLSLTEAGIPSSWILHEWWPPEMLIEELTKRNDKTTTPEIVNKALQTCARTVCVCKAQLDLYKPLNGAVTFVGVPTPKADWQVGSNKKANTVTFLCLGIVCPRKNQHWAIEIFKQWAGNRKDVKLLVVGARYIRQYEIDYVEKVKGVIGNDSRIELIDVTNDVDQYYRRADALLFTSLNEVTPMVIAEAMMRSMPVVTTDIAGIPEMFTHGVHGFALPPTDKAPFVEALKQIGGTDADGQRRRLQMGAAAKKHAMETFTNAGMVSAYREAALGMAAPIVLVDMDGVLVDWDAGFAAHWGGRSPIDRTKSYSMEACVPDEHVAAAKALYHSEGFFASLPPMAGGVAAVKAMAAMGYRVFICTAPVLSSRYCAQDKFAWVREHLGAEWLAKIIMTTDKTTVRGDVLIDDKPKISGAHFPVWKQLLFDAPYNQHVDDRPRLTAWADVGARLTEVLTSAHVEPPMLSKPGTPEESLNKLAQAVAALPDFSHLLPADYRADYRAWRGGKASGAKGELHDALERMEEMHDSVLNNTSEDFTEVNVYRQGYAAWRRGKASGAASKDIANSFHM